MKCMLLLKCAVFSRTSMNCELVCSMVVYHSRMCPLASVAVPVLPVYLLIWSRIDHLVEARGSCVSLPTIWPHALLHGVVSERL